MGTKKTSEMTASQRSLPYNYSHQCLKKKIMIDDLRDDENLRIKNKICSI